MNKDFGLITGASGLLGHEHACSLLEIGINTILTDINLKKLKDNYKRLKKKYPSQKIIIFKMDVSKEKSVKKIRDFIIRKKIKLKVLINNAAIDNKVIKNKKIRGSNSLDKINLVNVNKEISVGLIGAIICIKYFSK